MNPAPRRGWCPGVARPMPTGDGLLVRVHPAAGVLTAAQAQAIAAGARAFGNGQIDVTARGNLQLRGVTAATHARLAAQLDAAGLGDRRPDGGPQRLTLASPLAGLDAGLAALIATVERVGLAVAALPAKALVAVEAAGCGIGPVEADLWIRRIEGETRADLSAFETWPFGEGSGLRPPEDTVASKEGGGPPLPGGRGVGVRVARHQDWTPAVELPAARSGLSAEPEPPSPLPLSHSGEGIPRLILSPDAGGSVVESPGDYALAIATADGPLWTRPIPVQSLDDALATILSGFARSGARRLRALAPETRDALLAQAGLVAGEKPADDPPPPTPGLHPLSDGRIALLAEFPFGRCDAETLLRLAAAAARDGDGMLRPGSWRGAMLVAPDAERAGRLRREAAVLGLILDPHDPRRAVAACPGAPACASGGTAAQADAARLAARCPDLARRGVRVHVSGCAKGCAHPAPADLTLVGQPDGRYGVVLAGHAGNETVRTLPFEVVLERLNSARTDTDLIEAFREPA
ncbi:nitrite reductase [Methylobacterium sp. JK268]